MIAITGMLNKTSAQIVLSDKAGWHKIGEKTVDLAMEKGEMMVIGSNRFAELVFKVKDEPIEISSIDIYFTDGGTQHVNVGEKIKAPGQSKEVKLTDAERSIKKIDFMYKTESNTKNKKASLEIWGLKTNWEKNKPNP